MNTNPALQISRHVGGEAAVSELASSEGDVVPVDRVREWIRDESEGGFGGLVPVRYITRMLANAQERGIDLQPGDFVTPKRLVRLGAKS